MFATSGLSRACVGGTILVGEGGHR
eukprot:COSAG02_NODE_27988_length_598_cov_3.060120_1_plen_24_part_10